MQLSEVFVSLVLITASASAVPLLNKRIAQTIIDSVQGWENACDAANGGAQCNAIAVNASSALLAAADPCAQQDAGDIMVNIAKSLKNNQAMITAAQVFVQQPRNSPNGVAVNYCQHAPQNSELNGLFQCQFQGVDEQEFVNGQALGGPGTMPFGFSTPVNPLGSCPAHAKGPVQNGVQLSSLVSSPGTPSTSDSKKSFSPSTVFNSTSSSNSSTSVSSSNDSGNTSLPTPSQSGFGSANSSYPASTSSIPSSSTPFFASDGTAPGPVSVAPTAYSSYPASTSGVPPPSSTAGFATIETAPGLVSTAPAASSSAFNGGGHGFQFANGKDSQHQNAQFAGLTADSTCTDGQQACVNGGFAQCVGGKFAIISCAGDTQCFVLPLVNKPGTSITCTTESDAAGRITNTGATGGITGSSRKSSDNN